MTKMNEVQVVEEITQSKVFSSTFNRCSEIIRELFMKLAVESSIYSNNDKGYAKEMKATGYRLAKPYIKGRKLQNYCMFTLVPSGKIVVDVRTDGNPIHSEILNLRNKGNCFNGGFEWHQFTINDESQIYEALRIIEFCYRI